MLVDMQIKYSQTNRTIDNVSNELKIIVTNEKHRNKLKTQMPVRDKLQREVLKHAQLKQGLTKCSIGESVM